MIPTDDPAYQEAQNEAMAAQTAYASERRAFLANPTEEGLATMRSALAWLNAANENWKRVRAKLFRARLAAPPTAEA